jgi:DNA polymerase-4
MIISQHNQARPSVMHIDLNSCFATVMQQAYVHLRGKPLVISAYSTPRGFVLSPSIEAKKLGIKLGFNNADARAVCPDIIIRTPDPELVRDVHRKFRKIFESYSPFVVPKSIDEAVIDFKHTKYENTDLVPVGEEIRLRMRREIGEWISCSIGISTNRFLAKLAAGIHKPNGLDVIDAGNVEHIFSRMVLTDFPGIARRFELRLHENGIYTPLDFLAADEKFLHRKVFKSIVGHHWYMRMRGWEVDDIEFERKSYGQQYALAEKTGNVLILGRLLMKLCEKMGRRVRRAGYAARGISLALSFTDHTYLHTGHLVGYQMYTIWDFYHEAYRILHEALAGGKTVSQMSVSCFDLVTVRAIEEQLFDQTRTKKHLVSDAVDQMNDRYGEYVITPASMMRMDSTILDRIAFGNVREVYE